MASDLTPEVEKIMKEIREAAATIRAQWKAQQKKKLRNERTRQQYKRKALKQATQPATTPEQEQHTAGNNAEKATASCNTSLLPTTLHQATEHSDREPPHSSNKIHSCYSFRLRFLAKKLCHHTALASQLASLPGYMEYAEEMEATGQG